MKKTIIFNKWTRLFTYQKSLKVLPAPKMTKEDLVVKVTATTILRHLGYIA